MLSRCLLLLGILVFPLAQGALDDATSKKFKGFVKKYNKDYITKEEYLKREKIFYGNLRKIAKLQEAEQGTGIYGVTQFTDLTEDEFKQKYLGLSSANIKPAPLATVPDVDLPSSYDWRDHGVVTPVKNQGMCGSCWAFSTIGNVEGQYALATGKLLSLSEQELVDCDKEDSGCSGGYMTTAFHEIIELGGLETEDDYPYKGDNEECHLVQEKEVVQISSYVNLTTDETDMARWLVKNGPISVGINANAMQFYFGGVSHPFKFLCDPGSIDHGVLIVGYGVAEYPIFHKKLPYWIIKNSWGSHWGEKGYYRVYRGDGTCGVNTMASSSVITGAQ